MTNQDATSCSWMRHTCSCSHAVEVDEWVSIGGHSGIVRSVEPRLGERELQLVVQLSRDDLRPV
jgi:hypothetical protein